MISGQAPNDDTLEHCATYAEFPRPSRRATARSPDLDACTRTRSLRSPTRSPRRETGRHTSDMGSRPACIPIRMRLTTPRCPAPGLYATRHNPFIYFHSLLDLGRCERRRRTSISPAICARRRRRPSRSWHPDRATSRPRRLPGRNGRLGRRGRVPQALGTAILGSPAYKHDGVLIIAFADRRRSARAARCPPVRSCCRGSQRPASRERDVQPVLGAALDRGPAGLQAARARQVGEVVCRRRDAGGSIVGPAAALRGCVISPGLVAPADSSPRS